MNDRTGKTLKEHEILFTKMLEEKNWTPNQLKKKFLIGGSWPKSRAHTSNHGGGCGRAGRRAKGWGKHSKGPQNVPFYGRVSLKVMRNLERGNVKVDEE